MIRGLTALALALSTAGTAAAQTAKFDRFTYQGRSIEQVKPQAGEYLNPIVSGYYPDPSVTRVGKDYYLVNSSFAHFPGLPIFHSTDLVHWTQIGNAIDRPGQLDFSGRSVSEAVFAPDISYHDGTFYIVNTCVQCRGNFVITAKDPAGPWSDPIWLPFEGIDPSLYWEGDRAYIVNNRAPNETPRYDGHRAIWVQEYDWRAGKMVGESTQLVNGGVDLSKKPVWIEGPHIFKKDGWYYLTAAEGGTSVNHSQVVLRSKELRGPYVPFAGNPILTQRDLDPKRPHPISAAGHAELVQTQNGDWWATFLATRPYADDYYNIGRETFLLPVTWKNGWPIILDKGKTVPWTLAKPRLPASPAPKLPTSGDFGYTDEFDGTKLAMQWIGVRTPKTPFYTVANGSLTMRGG
ncbi:MAG TPA: family 43 glycosylhydrolase, partial [Sphingomonas sanguinis]